MFLKRKKENLPAGNVTPLPMVYSLQASFVEALKQAFAPNSYSTPRSNPKSRHPGFGELADAVQFALALFKVWTKKKSGFGPLGFGLIIISKYSILLSPTPTESGATKIKMS